MNVLPELDALAEGALLRPLPELASIVVSGPDRLTWLGGMLTSDVKGLLPGSAARSLVVNKTGRLQSEVWLLVEPERVLLAVPRALASSLREHLEGYLVMEDVELASDERTSFWVAFGPRSGDVAVDAARIGGTTGSGTLVGLAFVLVALPPGATRNALEALTAHNRAVLATPHGWTRARIEHLLPEAGIDYEPGCYPQEARLERFAVSFQKGCYVGQEAVFMLEKRGHPPKRLARLRVRGQSAVALGEEVLADDGSVAGHVTSSAPDGEDAWVLAMLRYKHATNGTVLRIREATATVAEPPA
ncbi:MAG: folate-binding protein YgfZ [Deltaproteobacteria bacterium]|nr:folate-binding protein YgfZ [Deltaproteobacteria bacterium]